jgi:hypothetical protein
MVERSAAAKWLREKCHYAQRVDCSVHWWRVRGRVVSGKSRRCCGELTRVGRLDLPIYVNPDTVRVDVDGASSSVTVSGMTKGYLDRGARSSLLLSQLLTIGVDSGALNGMTGITTATPSAPPRRCRIINPRIFSRLQFSKRSISITSPADPFSRDPTPEDPLHVAGRLRSHTT